MLSQKTNSVPNLTDHQQTNMKQLPVHSNPPAPPPPPPPLTNPPVLSYNARSAQKSLNCLVETSASNDTLVQEDSNGLTLDNNYEEEEHSLENTNTTQHIVNEPEYDQAGDLTASKAMNNNLVLMVNNKNNTSPLTPRQIKQRNNAKRGSISHQPNDSNVQSAAVLNSRQESDLQFLKSQKFDEEFIQTTKDLFSHYPNAKISISVSVQTYDESESTLNQVETNRQIEIDRVMFNKILESNEFINMARNTSTYHEASCTSTHSSSSSGYTSSSINSDQTPSINLKSEDLNEAIKKAANEHLIKKQSMPINPLPSKNFNSNPNKLVNASFQHQQNLSVKNELQRALENRLRKTMNLEAEQQQQQQVDQKNSTNNETLTVSNVIQKPTTSPPSPPLPPPPPPPLPNPQVNGISANLFPPPPSPQALHRLSSVEQNENNQGLPPPPPPPLFNQTPPQQAQTHQVAPSQTNASKNVKSMITNYQKLSDPRSSSDFGALIAQKAAEKRAKFQEAKPTANTVTFQPDGSKLFVSNNKYPNPNSKPSDNHSSLNNHLNRASQSNVIKYNNNNNNNNSFNQRESPKKVSDLKAMLNNDENTPTNTNVIKITVNPKQCQEDFVTSSNSGKQTH